MIYLSRNTYDSRQLELFWRSIICRDGGTRIRLLYYNLSNDHFVRGCRHGAILIPVFVIKSFRENRALSTQVQWGEYRRESAGKFREEGMAEESLVLILNCTHSHRESSGLLLSVNICHRL